MMLSWYWHTNRWLLSQLCGRQLPFVDNWMHLWSLSSSGMTSSSSSMSSEPLLNQVNLWPRSKSDAPTQKEPVRLNAFRMLTTFRFCAAVGSSASCPCRFRHSYCACGQGSASSLIRNLPVPILRYPSGTSPLPPAGCLYAHSVLLRQKASSPLQSLS